MTMPHFICTTCGTQYARSDQPPGQCIICEDDRQYVKATGQQWTAQVVANRKHVSFMYSYPNYVPLPAAKVRQVVGTVSKGGHRPVI